MSLSLSAKRDKGPLVEMLTSKGQIVLRLYNDTPLHRDNFLKLVREGYFTDLLFHRVIQDFMIQGGDPDSRDAAPGQLLGEGDPGYTLPAEIRYPAHFHKRGVLAAAREGDRTNPERRSSGSQFYIVWGKTLTPEELDKLDTYLKQSSGGKFTMSPEARKYYLRHPGTPHLDGAYTVYGETIKGLDIIDRIAQVATDNRDKPVMPVKIIKVRPKEQ